MLEEHDPLSDEDSIDARFHEEGISPTKETVHSVLIGFEPPPCGVDPVEYFDTHVQAVGAELHDLACVIVNKYPTLLLIRVACVTTQLRKLFLRENAKRYGFRGVCVESVYPARKPTEEDGLPGEHETGGEDG